MTEMEASDNVVWQTLNRLTSWLILVGAVFLTSFSLLQAAQPEFSEPPQPPIINLGSIDGHNATFHFNNTPLHTVLQHVALQGIHVEADPLINQRVTFHGEQVDIAAALKIVLRDVNHVITWEKRGNVFFPFKIEVFALGQKHRMEQVLPDGNLRVTRDAQTGALIAAGEMLIKKKSTTTEAEFLALVEKAGGKILSTNEALGIYQVSFPAGQNIAQLLEQLQESNLIEQAEPNYIVTAPVTTADISIANITPVQDGEVDGPRVAVLDSGLSQELLAQSWVAADFDSVNPNSSIEDPSGHGTQMAMLASGVVTPLGTNQQQEDTTEIIAVRAFDANGISTHYNLLQSLNFAAENQAQVISMSWGSSVRSDFLEQELTQAAANGIILVAAAGNEATGEAMYPAAYDAVIGVGALTTDGNQWEHSNYGDFVEIYAPGFATFTQDQNTQALYGGTSISTAYVANTIASYLKTNPDVTLKEVRQMLQVRFPAH